ncbi:hypothetical protein GGI20_006038 [Coemansia sp. BCRC 34301]|nr:hypothetical protein GGI20_006038 [Coemansia sp. BCRC 34301]
MKAILVKIHCYALSHLGIVQRKGRYPLPPEVGPILGVESAGVVADMAPMLNSLLSTRDLSILFKRLRIEGSTLRPRSLEYQRRLGEAFARNVLPRIEFGEMFCHADRGFAWEDIQDAHRLMASVSFTGKIVVRVTDNSSDLDLSK